MRVLSKPAIIEFCEKHTAASGPLLAWYKLAMKCKASDLESLKETFGSVDYVQPKQFVFNVGGNNYRVIAGIDFMRQKMFILHIYTHEEYDEWTRKNRGK